MRIVVFDIDCLRPDHLGCYGYDRPTSPNIDKIAKEGVRFNRYYCSDAPCLPSRMALTSGRFGIHNNVISNCGVSSEYHIRKKSYGGPEPDNMTLPRQLRKLGIGPVSFSNFADRHNAMWFMNGWEEFHTVNLKGGQETAEEVHEKVMPWLKNNATRDNYLLHINYWDTHRVYKMDESWADRFKDSPVTQEWPDEAAIAEHQKIKGPFTANAQFKDNTSSFPLMPGAIRNRREFEHMITGYDASIAYVDHHVGIVMDELERQGVLEDAILIVTSDHGDAFGEHGVYSDHVMADECINRIPMIIRWPGVSKQDHACDSLLYSIDLAPTLCDLLGGEAPSEWDGESYAANLRGETGLEREYVVYGHALYCAQRAVRTKQHLMVRTYDGLSYGLEPVELYDMDADPYQTKNIAKDNPDLVAKMDHYLNEWLQEQRTVPHPIPDPMDRLLEERAMEMDRHKMSGPSFGFLRHAKWFKK